MRRAFNQRYANVNENSLSSSFPSIFSHQKGPEFSGEIADSKSGTGKYKQTSCYVWKQDST